MRALVYTAPGHVELQNLPKPQPGPEEVLIEVAAAGICGSDVHGFHGKSRIRIPPMVMGHEFTGRVAAVGQDVRNLKAGQRVVVQPVVGCGQCRFCLNGRSNICLNRTLIGGHRPGAFAEYVIAPARVVYPISDALSDTLATLVEPLTNAVHMLGFGGNLLERDVVVLGSGPLGLLTVAAARESGARHVIATDVADRRLEVARQLGADVTLNARAADTTERIREITGGGADLVIDAAGFTASRRQGVAVTTSGGTLVLLGLVDAESDLPALDIINREIRVQGSYSGTDDDFRRAIRLMEAGAIDAEPWLEIAGLEQGQEYFERLSSGTQDLVKVVFMIDGKPISA